MRYSYIYASYQSPSSSFPCKTGFTIPRILVSLNACVFYAPHHHVWTAEHQSNNFALLRAKMRRLPPVHQATLKALVEHLSRVVAFSDKNKMDAKNLAIVFGGVIFGDDEMPKGGDLLNVQNWKVGVDTWKLFIIVTTQIRRIL